MALLNKCSNKNTLPPPVCISNIFCYGFECKIWWITRSAGKTRSLWSALFIYWNSQWPNCLIIPASTLLSLPPITDYGFKYFCSYQGHVPIFPFNRVGGAGKANLITFHTEKLLVSQSRQNAAIFFFASHIRYAPGYDISCHIPSLLPSRPFSSRSKWLQSLQRVKEAQELSIWLQLP